MGVSAFRKKPNERNLTRKMIQDKMDDMAALMVAMEATLMEWEVWFRLVKHMKEGMSEEEFAHYVMDGPIFTDTPGKIMQSIREQLPELEPPEEENKSAVLDGSGNATSSKNKPMLTDANGNPIISGNTNAEEKTIDFPKE